jgi:hypothetical protein
MLLSAYRSGGGELLRGQDRPTPAETAAAAGRCQPARVRSRMSSRANSASAPNRCSCSRRAGVLVSIASVNERKPTSRSARTSTTSMRCLQPAPEAIKPPDDQDVARAQVIEARLKLRALTQRAEPVSQKIRGARRRHRPHREARTRPRLALRHDARATGRNRPRAHRHPGPRRLPVTTLR